MSLACKHCQEWFERARSAEQKLATIVPLPEMPEEASIKRERCGVWMMTKRDNSVARQLAEDAMRALGHDVNDFMERDKVISALRWICGVLDEAAGIGIKELGMSDEIEKYFFKHYFKDHCALCGNSGVIDTRGVTTAAGVEVGRLNFCLCPNGRTMRKGLPGVKLDDRYVKGHGTHREWFERAKMAEQKLADLKERLES